jgi:hypothetical protein
MKTLVRASIGSFSRTSTGPSTPSDPTFKSSDLCPKEPMRIQGAEDLHPNGSAACPEAGVARPRAHALGAVIVSAGVSKG